MSMLYLRETDSDRRPYPYPSFEDQTRNVLSGGEGRVGRRENAHPSPHLASHARHPHHTYCPPQASRLLRTLRTMLRHRYSHERRAVFQKYFKNPPKEREVIYKSLDINTMNKAVILVSKSFFHLNIVELFISLRFIFHLSAADI